MDAIYDPKDAEICRKLLERVKTAGAHALPGLIAAVGRHFLDTPYEAGTLERKGPEMLVVNLRAFDCVTFVENAVVLAGLILAGRADFAGYLAALEWIRYRRGTCNGYPSRLHYFTDWLYDNDRKGIVRNVTRQIGGVPFPKVFCRLTNHRADQPALGDPAVFRRMRIIEGICTRRPLFHIQKADLGLSDKRIENGDIIAVTTDDEGIDIRHTGIALRVRGKLHLLHASSAAGRVVLSDKTLGAYLADSPGRTGIIVGRAVPTAVRHLRRRPRDPRDSTGLS